MRRDIQAGLSERQLGVVEVQQIGLVLVDQFLAAEKPAFARSPDCSAAALRSTCDRSRVPRVGVLDRGDAVRHDDVRPGVELLRIEAFPPLALAVFLLERERVVAHAGLGPSGSYPYAV